MIDQAFLISRLSYDPEAGIFRWLHNSSNTRAGAVAGSVDTTRGYRQIGIGGRHYFAHRLAHLYMTGEWPVGDMDHRNGMRDDNRWANLRPCTRAQNNQNLPKLRTNKNGYPGVQQVPSGRWLAQIRACGERLCLGTFDTPDEAYAAYLAAKAAYHKFQPVPRYEASNL